MACGNSNCPRPGRVGRALALGWISLLWLIPVGPAFGGYTAVPMLLSFEDGWPSQSDDDYNDVVVRYQLSVYEDATGKLSRVIYTVQPQAVGGISWNGLALRIFAPASTPHFAQIRKNGEAPTVIDPVTGEPKLTFVLYDNVRDAFPGAAAGDFINTQQGAPVHLGENLEFEVQFDPPLDLSIDSPFDFFIFRSGNYSHQIHLPQFGPTALALEDPVIADLFGTEDDCSNQLCIAGDGSVVDNIGRYYVDQQGTPGALEMPQYDNWTKEGSPIDQVFPDFSEWVASQGATHTDWWREGNALYLFNLFAPPSVPGLLPGAVWVLLGTLAGLGALRLRKRL